MGIRETAPMEEDDPGVVLDALPAIVWTARGDGHVDFVNRRWSEYTGLSLGEGLGWGWQAVVNPDDLPWLLERWRVIVGSGRPGEVQARLRRFDGKHRRFLLRCSPVRDAAGRIIKWCGMNTDVDDLEQAGDFVERHAADLQPIVDGAPVAAVGEARAELARASSAMSFGALTASIAHEINQPLSGIITNAGICLRMLAADPPNIDGARETARRTIRDGNRAAEVIGRLRALFRRRLPAIEPVDLNDAAREVISLLSSDLQSAGVILHNGFVDDLPLVGADRVQIQQVIMNLLRNAMEAMSGVDDRPRRLVIASEPDEQGQVRVIVRDTGVGFGPEGAEPIFDAFYTTKREGMGIGLSVSRSIIESHHGRIWALPNDGPGVTFAFSLPRYSPDAAPTREARAARSVGIRSGEEGTAALTANGDETPKTAPRG